jgi:hypothetical protein
LRRFLTPLLIVAALYVGWDHLKGSSDAAFVSSAGNEVLASAFRDQRSGLQVSGTGVVDRVLSDDNDGSRHQRFILRLNSGQTLLVAHNIDLAPRLTALREGDTVAFNGVYEWNEKGGVIHWTHRDPSGEHQAGWLKLNGETYQ